MNIVFSFANVITVTFTLAGLFFFFAGAVALLRFPDTLCRLHALTKADNLGLGFIVLGLLPQMDSAFDAVQLLLIWLLVMAASATCSLLIANHLTAPWQRPALLLLTQERTP